MIYTVEIYDFEFRVTAVEFDDEEQTVSFTVVEGPEDFIIDMMYVCDMFHDIVYDQLKELVNT